MSITKSAKQWKINMNEATFLSFLYGIIDFNGQPLSSLTMISLISARSLKFLELMSLKYFIYFILKK